MIEIDGNVTQVVWFDLDDTLVDFRANSKAAMSSLFEASILKRLFENAEAWFRLYEPYNNLLWSKFNRGEIDSKYLRAERFMHHLVAAGIEPSQAKTMAVELDSKYLDLLSAEKKLVPGSLQLLNRLYSLGYSIGILSNGFKEVQTRKLHSSGIHNFIDFIVVSDDIGVTKPDVRIYRHAMSISRIDDPTAHLMIGDNPATDIQGAVEAGWRAVLFDRHNLLYPPSPTEKITDFTQITVKNSPNRPKIMQK